LVIPVGADTQGLELRLDGVLIGGAALGVPTPVDPGLHVIEAKAPGKLPWSTRVELGSVADQQTVTVPALETAVAAPPPASPPPLPVPSIPPPLPARDAPAERPIPTSVYVAGGATLALAVAASVTGGIYLDRRAAFDERGRFVSDRRAAEEERDSVRTLGLVNLGLWFAGGAGAALTTYFYVTRPERPRSSATLRFAGWADARSAGLTARGEL
jgi:hypothetical protein